VVAVWLLPTSCTRAPASAAPVEALTLPVTVVVLRCGFRLTLPALTTAPAASTKPWVTVV